MESPAAGGLEGVDDQSRPLPLESRARLQATPGACASSVLPADLLLPKRPPGRTVSRHVATGLVGLLMVRGEMGLLPEPPPESDSPISSPSSSCADIPTAARGSRAVRSPRRARGLGAHGVAYL